jgi:hypothetical protein
LLTGEATVVVQMRNAEHRVCDFRRKAALAILENEIGNLRESAANDWVVGRQLDIALSKNVPDVSRLGWH